MARPLPRSGYAILLATVLFAFSSARADLLTIGDSSAGITSIRSDNGVGNGTASQLIVGQFAGGDRRGRALLSFDLSTIPEGALIQSVTLVLTLDSGDAGSTAGLVPLELYQITGGSFAETTANWSTRDGATNWTTAGGDFSPTLLSSANADPLAAVGTKINFGSTAEFVDSVSDNVGGTVSFLVKLNAADEGSSTRRTFFLASDDTSNVGRAPVFTVEYMIPEPGSSLLLLVSLALAQTARWRRR